MSFLQYQTYKNCGVQWLGDVPAHWETRRLKYALRLLTEKATRQVHPVALENIESWSGRFIETETQFEGEGVSFSPGDILFGKLRPYLAKVYLAELHGEAVGDFHVLRPLGGIIPKFAQYQMLNRDFIAVVDGSTFGAKMPRVSWDFLGGMILTVPPLEEQRRIVEFLDQEVAKIKVLIGEQQRLIQLLKEKRQALIFNAVTNGLNGETPLKAAGIDWLAYVPAHWQIVRLGSIFSEACDPGNDDLPLLSVSIHHGVSDREFDDDELDRKVARSEDRTKYKCVKVGDLVYNMMRAWQGGFGTVTVPGMVSPAYVVARPIVDVQTQFVEQFLRTPTAVEELRRYSHGVTDFRLRLYWDEFKSIKVAIPPIEEQKDILAYLGRETAQFDALTAEATSAVSLLQERRTALISAAVTGRIDLREVTVAQQPAEEAS